MTDHENIVANTIRLAEARTAQARAEAALIRTKLGQDAPAATDPQADTSWAGALFHRRTRKLDISEMAHDIRQDGPKQTQPKRPEASAHQKRTTQIRETGQLFPGTGAHLTTNDNDRNN